MNSRGLESDVLLIQGSDVIRVQLVGDASYYIILIPFYSIELAPCHTAIDFFVSLKVI